MVLPFITTPATTKIILFHQSDIYTNLSESERMMDSERTLF